MKFRVLVGWCVLASALAISAAAQAYNEAQFKGMKWRGIGPYRGGRVLAVTGIPGSPFTYYFGGVAGGVVLPGSSTSLYLITESLLNCL